MLGYRTISIHNATILIVSEDRRIRYSRVKDVSPFVFFEAKIIAKKKYEITTVRLIFNNILYYYEITQ